MDAFREKHLTGGVPPCLVHHQQDVLVLSGSHLLGEFFESQRVKLGVHRGQDQPEDLPALRTDEAVEVGPLVAPLEAGHGSLSHRSPHTPGHRLEAQPSFVLCPQLHLGAWIRFPQRLLLHLDTFLKASFSESSARALEGLGTWGLYLALLRYSKPRWTCTFSNPFLLAIQRATFGPLHIPPPTLAGGGPCKASSSSSSPASSSRALSLAPGLEWRRSPRASTPRSLFFFSSRRRHTRSLCDWSSDVCSSDLFASPSMSARQVGRSRYATASGR